MLSDKDLSHTKHTSPKSSLWLTRFFLRDIDISKSLRFGATYLSAIFKLIKL